MQETGLMAEDQRELKDERNRFVAFAFAAADAFVEAAADGTILYATGATRALLGRDGDALVGRSLFELVAPEQQARLRAVLETGTIQGRFGFLPLGFRGSGGERHSLELSGTYLPRGGGRHYLALGRTSGAELLPVATEHAPDGKGLLDRDAFAEAANRLISAAGGEDSTSAMTLLELKGLQALNARLGEAAAAAFDSELTEFINAHLLGASTTARFDEGKFGLLHDESLDLAAMTAVLGRRAAEADPEGRGIAVESHTLRLHDLGLSETDNAKALLYTINKFCESRGEFTISDLAEGHRQMLDETRFKISAFREMTAKANFDIVFQPIVDLKRRQLHHHEALARFRRREASGSTFDLVSFAEEAGIIMDFDLAVVRKVIQRLQAAHDAGQAFSISVNLSGRSLETPRFHSELTRLLQGSGVAPADLIFEVTESSEIRNLDAVNGYLTRLRSQGHKVCLDDFGAGAAAFHYLRGLDVDYVKIDGTYVRNAIGDNKGGAFLRAIATLCESLGIATIAEMIETEEIAAHMRDLGITYGQGFLFGRPAGGLSGSAAARAAMVMGGRARRR
ncbi:MAG TPA: EAL domain-containing protein [Alphaproteobacteria bacterium]|nr:EAL domain-containing protein [Alphaproteobacteria bacterium]